MPYIDKTEPAKTGKSRCRQCKNLIAQGDTRYGVAAFKEEFGGRYHKWYHPKCADQANLKHKPLNKMLASGQRFRLRDYAEFVGEEFVLQKEDFRNPRYNGTYILRIFPGYPGNKLCDEFRAALVQQPADGRKAPTILYPPESGDTNKLNTRLDGEQPYIEVRSMTQMMKESVLQQNTSPAVMFGLREKLAEKRANPPCRCDIYNLMIRGCTCGALEREAGMKKDQIPAKREPNLSLDLTDRTRVAAVPVDAPDSSPDESHLLTAASVLEAVVSTHYQDAAEEVAGTRARVEVNQQVLMPGMVVYHIFKGLPYVLIEETEKGIWTIEDPNAVQQKNIPVAVLTNKYPGHLKRIWAEMVAAVTKACDYYWENEHIRKASQNTALFTLATIFILTMTAYVWKLGM